MFFLLVEIFPRPAPLRKAGRRGSRSGKFHLVNSKPHRERTRVFHYETWSPRKDRWIPKKVSCPRRAERKSCNPNKQGKVLSSAEGSYDAHQRLEGGEIMIDVFESREKDPDKAYVETQSFSNDWQGKREAEQFLQSYGFMYRLP